NGRAFGQERRGMSSPKQLESDVGILGGGPAGTTIARVLAQSGFSVKILEAGNYRRPMMGQTLSPALNPLLTQLGIESHLGEMRSPLCRGVASVWGSQVVQDNEYFWTPYGNGWHVERPSFDRKLARLALRDGVELIHDAKLRSCAVGSRGRWLLE